MTPSGLIGALATALSMMFIWPQVFRIYRNKTVEGLAPLGALQGMSGSILWATYGLSRGDLPLFGSNTLVATAVGLICLAMTNHGVVSRKVLFTVVVGVIGVGFVSAAISPTLVGAVAFVVGALSIIPQTVKALRDPNLFSVSVSSNTLLFFTSSAWLVYGLMIGDALVATPNFLVIPCSAIIVQRARASQRRVARLEDSLTHVG